MVTGNGPIVALCTDFGIEGPYIGQMKAVLYQRAPRVRVLDLFSDLPPFQPKAAAYLLPAYVDGFPPGTVFICVVDPGVGGDRLPLVVKADGRFFVGPDNGLFNLLIRRAREVECRRVTWVPEHLSSSFHGRDLFAPVGAMLACGETPPGVSMAPPPSGPPEWPDDLPQVVYIDHFGNAMTGLRACAVAPGRDLAVRGRAVAGARTFSDVPRHGAFWYENANGLVEISVNQGRADEVLGIAVGDSIEI
ncbi:MAG TPA: SAM-dependent chlorinase/fluorinase [Gammaproteobacteria bacterium]|nr:SAM-dependent chlorinase/fluorinase [Gammaproteobacteria bacterium]